MYLHSRLHNGAYFEALHIPSVRDSVVAAVPALTLQAALAINNEVDHLVFNKVVSKTAIENPYPEFNAIAGALNIYCDLSTTKNDLSFLL